MKFKIGFHTFTHLVSLNDSIHILRPSHTRRDYTYVAVLDEALQSQIDKLEPPVKVEGCFPRGKNIYRVAEIANGVSRLLEHDPGSLLLKELYATSLREVRAEIEQHFGLDCLHGDGCLTRNYYHLIATILIGTSCHRWVSIFDPCIYEVRLLAPYRVTEGLIFRFEGNDGSLIVTWDKIWSINALGLYLQNPHLLRGLSALPGWLGAEPEPHTRLAYLADP